MEIESLGASIVPHLIELRHRLIRIVVSILVVFLVMTPFANSIYHFLAQPLLQFLPENTSMIAIDVASPFFTPFKLVFVTAILIAIPVILYHFWAFIAPALYSHEKRMMAPLLIASIGLFALGMAFAYFVALPLIFGFLTTAAPNGVAMMTDISKYLDFIITLFFAFGLAFEVPIITIVLIWSGLFTRAQLAEKRPYVIVGAFIIAMFLTPPDAISQTLLAIPIWFLFESGLLFSWFFIKPKADKSLQK